MSYSKFYAKPTPYPSNKEGLYSRLLFESTTPPLKHGLEYFQNYINHGGGRIHPILGDLGAFILDVNARWDHNEGSNFVVGFLLSKLGLDIVLNPAVSPSM